MKKEDQDFQYSSGGDSMAKKLVIDDQVEIGIGTETYKPKEAGFSPLIFLAIAYLVSKKKR